MATLQNLREELDDITTMGFISQAFTEVAASKIQQIKSAFETNREFYEEISYLYHLVRVSSLKEDKAGSIKAEDKPKNDKKMMAAITSNQRFYGNLNINIMQTFTQDLAKEKCDVIVVGSTGSDFMGTLENKINFTKMNFVHDNPTEEETSKFIDAVKPYRNIILYYPKFVTLMTQKVGIIDIAKEADMGENVKNDEINILFEPEVSKIIEFFERYVRAILFHRVMLEADLSRTAARLLTMSGADERSRDMIKAKKSQIRKLQLSIANAKLLETSSSLLGIKRNAKSE